MRYLLALLAALLFLGCGDDEWYKPDCAEIQCDGADRVYFEFPAWGIIGMKCVWDCHPDYNGMNNVHVELVYKSAAGVCATLWRETISEGECDA